MHLKGDPHLEHHADVRVVDAPGRDVGGEKDHPLALPKLLGRPCPSGLRLPGVDLESGETDGLEELGVQLGSSGGGQKDEDLHRSQGLLQ